MKNNVDSLNKKYDILISLLESSYKYFETECLYDETLSYDSRVFNQYYEEYKSVINDIKSKLLINKGNLKFRSEENNGIYNLYLKYSKNTCINLVELQRSLKLKNPVDKEKFHTTVVYSNTSIYTRDFEGEEDIHINAMGTKIGILESKDNKKCVVLFTNSKNIRNKFNNYIDLGATWDYPEYQPHITLSKSEDDDTIEYIKNNFSEDINIELLVTKEVRKIIRSKSIHQ